MFRIILPFMLAASCFAANPIIIGVRGGARLNDIVDSVNNAPTVGQTFQSATENYIVGPTLGVRLPAGFSLVGDALFTRLSFDVNRSSTLGIDASAYSWEFPVMVKWTLPSKIGPFVGAGVSVRHLSDFSDVGGFITGNNGTPLFPDQNTVGFVIGGGVNFKAGPVHIEPEIRWTRYNQRDVGSAFQNFFNVNRNQAQILLGITF